MDELTTSVPVAVAARDKYDRAIDWLREHPDRFLDAWGLTTPAACLFDFVKMGCGCLTQVRSGIRRAPTDELTDRIRADDRIPRQPEDITIGSLPVFAEWQRRLDRALGADRNGRVGS